MKKILLILLLVVLVLACVGCAKKANKDEPPLTIAPTLKKGDIGAFTAVTPQNAAEFTVLPTFKWNSAENADSYTLEICTKNDFKFDAEGVYIKKVGILGTEFNLAANLKKNTDYYWRVTAENDEDYRVFDEKYLTFRYNADEQKAIPIEVGYADEWKVHEKGSKATVSLEPDFFTKDENALRVYFEREDTQRGEKYTESNGWVVVTRSLESEFYGLDAFSFNFYYMGNDAKAFFRVIDEDNEYWYAPIKIAMNTKQTIVMRLEDFVLRTNGTPVVNQKFDSHYLKNMELVFERVDGDGVAYFGNLNAIHFDDIRDRFIQTVNFENFVKNEEGKPNYSVEGKYFLFDKVEAIENGAALHYSFTVDQDTVAKINNKELSNDYSGNGFLTLPIGKMLTNSDAFTLEIDAKGMSNKNFNFIFRMIEEDNDVWSFTLKGTEIPADGKLVIPFAAFNIASGGAKGDGAKQFYYVNKFQFGMNNYYSGGSMIIRNLGVCTLSAKMDSLYTVKVSKEGVIEDFDTYENTLDVYYKWEPSTVNKDESMDLVDAQILGGNNKAVNFYYKTDLTEASYRTSFSSVSGYNAIEVWAKDLPKDGSDATMYIYLSVGTHNYYAKVTGLSDEWTSYLIPFEVFKSEESGYAVPKSSEKIDGVSLAFQYFFNKKAEYKTGSAVSVDKILFTKTDKKSVEKTTLLTEITFDDQKDIAMIDAFNGASGINWYVNKSVVDSLSFNPESALTLNSEKGTIEMAYKTQMASPYAAEFLMDSDVKAKGVTFRAVGDDRLSTLEVVLYADSKSYVAKVTLLKGDNTYSIGFDNFLTSEGEAFLSSKVTNISKIGLIIKNNGKDYNYYTGVVSLDEIYFDNTIETSAK